MTDYNRRTEDTPSSSVEDPESGLDNLEKSDEFRETAEGGNSICPSNEFIRNFSSLWFTVALDVGVLSIIMHILPYQFHGLPVLSTIMFVLTLVIYATVWSCFIARWILYWDETKRRIFNDAEEIALTGAPIIAYFTIVGQVALTCSVAWGFRLTVLAYALWWIGVAFMVLQCSSLYISLSKERLTDDEHLPTAVFLPIVGVMTASSIGGIICNNAVGITARMALPIIIVSYLCLGYAIFLAMAVYAAYLHRLIIVGWPPAEKIPSMILTIGPMGQSATALQLLATTANQHKIFQNYNKGFFLQSASAEVLSAVSILLALLLLGFAIFWIIVAYFAIIQALIYRRLKPTLVWWSTIFPMGTVATATVQLANAMDSPAFRVLACILLVFLLVIFFANAVLTGSVLLNSKRRMGHPFFQNRRRGNRACKHRT